MLKDRSPADRSSDPRESPRSAEPSIRDKTLVDRNDPLAWLFDACRCNTWWRVALVVVLIFGFGEKFVLPLAQGYFRVGGPLSDWRPDLEALLTAFVGFPGIFAFYAWSARSIPELFESFHQGELFRNGDRYRDFIDEISKSPWWFSSLKWTILSAIGAVGLSVGLFHLYLWDLDDPKPVIPWFAEGEPLSRIVAVMLLTVVLYAGWQVLFREIVLAFALHRLWRRLGKDLILRSKRDDVGGLSQLANHVGYLIVLLTLVLITFAMASALPALREEEVGDFAVWIWLIWLVYFTVVPSVFLALVWPAHRAMQDQRHDRLAVVAGRIDAATIKIEESVEADDLERIDGEMSRVSKLRELHGWLAEDIPTWPFARVIRTQITWSALIPTAYTIVTLLLDIGAQD